MSLDNLDVVDPIGTDRATGPIELSIIDDWDWSDPQRHLVALQAKLNLYFEFIETGQLEQYDATGRQRDARITVIFREQLLVRARELLSKADSLANQNDTTVSWDVQATGTA